MRGLNVLSLFDGMSCGHLALDRAGIPVANYYASEIDKHAIKVTQKNYPETIQLGDVQNVHAVDLPRIDLLIGGSPCQGFSLAGKGLNFDDPRSKLFFEYHRLWVEISTINPAANFLLENVQMKVDHVRVISKYMGVTPLEINSALVSAQNRERLYWTNINMQPQGLFGELMPDIPQPKDKGIMLRDILEKNVDQKYYLSSSMLNYLSSRQANFNAGKINFKGEDDKASCINASSSLDISDNIIVDQIGVLNDRGELREKSDKANCIDANYHKGVDDHGQRTMVIDRKVRQLNMDQSFGTQPRQQHRVYDGNGISPALLAELPRGSHIFELEGLIRRLTPVECERLQTVPDNYTDCASNTQRYRMLGNGWTVDVIAHILKYRKP